MQRRIMNTLGKPCEVSQRASPPAGQTTGALPLLCCGPNWASHLFIFSLCMPPFVALHPLRHAKQHAKIYKGCLYTARVRCLEDSIEGPQRATLGPRTHHMVNKNRCTTIG